MTKIILLSLGAILVYLGMTGQYKAVARVLGVKK